MNSVLPGARDAVGLFAQIAAVMLGVVVGATLAVVVAGAF